MPKGFQKGRQKTGGRQKGAIVQKSPQFVEQLKRHGFNLANEFAKCLKDLPPERKLVELKALLPYLLPKLRERDVEIVSDQVLSAPTESISNEALLEAVNGKPKPIEPVVKPAANKSPSLLPESPEGPAGCSGPLDEEKPIES